MKLNLLSHFFLCFLNGSQQYFWRLWYLVINTWYLVISDIRYLVINTFSWWKQTLCKSRTSLLKSIDFCSSVENSYQFFNPDILENTVLWQASFNNSPILRLPKILHVAIVAICRMSPLWPEVKYVSKSFYR